MSKRLSQVAGGDAMTAADREHADLLAELTEAQMEYADCWHEGDRLRALLAAAERRVTALEEALWTTADCLDEALGAVQSLKPGLYQDDWLTGLHAARAALSEVMP